MAKSQSWWYSKQQHTFMWYCLYEFKWC